MLLMICSKTESVTKCIGIYNASPGRMIPLHVYGCKVLPVPDGAWPCNSQASII